METRRGGMVGDKSDHNMEVRIIVSNLFKRSFSALKNTGVDIDVALYKCGTSREKIFEVGNEVSFEIFYGFIETLYNKKVPGDFPLKLAASLTVNDWGIVGLAVVSSKNCHGYYMNFNRYTALTGDIGPFLITTSESHCIMQLKSVTRPKLHRFYSQFLFTHILANVRRLNQREERPQLLKFRHSKGSEHPSLVAYFGCQIEYNQDDDEMLFPLSINYRENPFYNQSAINIVLNRFKRVEKLSGGLDSYTHKVKQFLLADMNEELPTVISICRALSVSQRTLRRRLEEEGSCFNELVNETRMQLAKDYLIDSSFSIQYIADRLFYASSSSFSRAFKNHVKMPPKVFRNGGGI